MGDPIVVPAAPANNNTVVVPKRVFNDVKTVGLEVTSNHFLLKDNTSDWTKAGNLYPKPEFKFGVKSAPVSCTRDQTLTVTVTFEVWPKDAPLRDCAIKGVTTWGLAFETKAPLKGGVNPVVVPSLQKLPDKVAKLAGDITWTIDNGADGPMSAGASWGHVIFVTVGTPMNDREGIWEEDGITLKRMSQAMSWIEPLGTLKAHEIMVGLRKQFPEYSLSKNKAVPVELKHPRYLKQSPSKGGAWPMVDYMAYSGECQAHVRLQRAAMRQLGVPCQARVYVVWTEPGRKKGEEVIEGDWDTDDTAGLNAERVVNGRTQTAALVDAPVIVGQVYPPAHTRMPDGTTSPGLNRYEACLRVVADGETKYYGGGADVYKDKDEVMSKATFWGLIWVDFISDDDPDTADPFRVVEIVKKYR